MVQDSAGMFFPPARCGLRVRMPGSPNDAAAAGKSPRHLCESCETRLLATAQDDAETVESRLAEGKAGSRICRIINLAAGTRGEIKLGTICCAHSPFDHGVRMKRAKTSPQKLLPDIGKTLGTKWRNGGYFQAVRLERDEVPSFEEFPFSIPSIQHLTRLEFHPAVTFFIGENGSGKSTLLEAIAIKAGFSAEGGDKQLQFDTHSTHSSLHDFLRLERSFERPTDGFFLRAESFYNVASELEKIEAGVPSKKPFYAYGGKSLHRQSHGESFLAVLKERLQGGGVYLFDEPEAALSPQRQLSVLALFHRLV